MDPEKRHFRRRLAEYYFDIETAHKDLHDPDPRGNLDPKRGRIIIISYQQLDSRTGEQIGPLNILKEWDSSEREILDEFRPLITQNWWNFIPIGYNLSFEFKFLREKFSEHFGFDFSGEQWLERPKKDLQTIGVMMNRGAFKGSSLDSFTSKPTDGGKISGWYRDGDEGYTKIMDYVNEEVEAFVTAWRTLKRELPKLRSSL